MELCATQQVQLAMLRDAVQRSERPPAILLTGSPGSGKRTITRELSNELGVDFEEVWANDEAEALDRRLFGGREEADRAGRGGPAPGVLGRDEPTLVFLSGLQSLPIPFAQQLSAAISGRRYTDALGVSWTVSDSLLIIGARDSRGDATVSADHWLWTVFERNIQIDIPSEPDDLRTLVDNMIDDLGASMRPGEAEEVMSTLAEVVKANDHLKLLRRVLEASILVAKDRTIGAAEILAALSSELRWLLTGIVYRGSGLSEERVRIWLDQFPSALRGVAFQVFAAVARHYYVSPNRFYAALDELIQSSGILPYEYVSFCKWQELGASGPRVANAMKNQANWRLGPDVDLLRNRIDAEFGDRVPDWFVLADDMVGTGSTLRKITRGDNAPIRLLLQRFPEAKIRILIVIAFEGPLTDARDDLADLRDRVEVIPAILLRASDRCFTSSSSILPEVGQRQALMRFCAEGCDGRLRIARRHRLGYGKLGALVVFPDTVPNNSLPILWYNSDSWKPLFPASGREGLSMPVLAGLRTEHLDGLPEEGRGMTVLRRITVWRRFLLRARNLGSRAR